MSRKPTPEPCPNLADHAETTLGYVAWHEWAAEMEKTHRQVRCPGCGLYAIWLPIETPTTERP